MTQSQPSQPLPPLYRRLLVATGSAAHSEVALRRAGELALHFGATLHVVTVIPQGKSSLENVAAAFAGGSAQDARTVQDERDRLEQYLRHTAQRLRDTGAEVQEHLVEALKPADAILAVAQEVGADLIVLGRRHKTAWSAALAGSVSDMVSHASAVDVLVVR